MKITVTPGNFARFDLSAGSKLEFLAGGFGQTLVQDGTQNTCIKGSHTCETDQSFTAFNCSPQPMTIKVIECSIH
jgi:hypothetical protein